MRLPGARRVRRGLGRVRDAAGRALDPPGLILLYHRVARPALDPWGISVQPERFAEHLEVLRRRARPVPLDQFPPFRHRRRQVALTFDDGYADNLHQALPLLEHFGIPATVFVASGSVGQAGPFWWDELGQLLLGDHALPGKLRLEAQGEIREWTLGEAARGHPSGRSDWRAETELDAGPRERLYLDLYGRLRGLPPPQRNLVLSTLRAWAGPTPLEEARTSDPLNRPLTSAELAELAAHPLVEIGAHTVTHPPLGDLDPADQRAEIGESRADLERLLGRPVTSFSLPYGSRGAQTETLVREAGFLRSCTSVGGAVRRGVDPLALPRVSVGDWTGEEFAERLDHWLGG